MKVYGFFYTDCIWENGGTLESLHLTKKGAYKAMRKWLIKQYNDWEGVYRNKKGRSLSSRHRPPHYDRNMEIWYIREFEVLD